MRATLTACFRQIVGEAALRRVSTRTVKLLFCAIYLLLPARLHAQVKVTISPAAANLPTGGRILLTGGQDAITNVISSAEIFDPAAAAFSLTGSMLQGRFGHTATLLGNGDVLIVGGFSDSAASNIVTSAELYSPVTGLFSAAANPNVPRADHSATMLLNGQVLVAGGIIAGQQDSTSTELYDPVAGSFTLAGNMSAPRYNHTATRLNGGRVLIAEGISPNNGGVGNRFAPDDLYDPATGLITPVGTAVQYFKNNVVIPFDSVLLANGQVLVDQGNIFDPVANGLATFNPLNSLSATLSDYKFVSLPNNQVFVAGGQAAAYLFDPPTTTYSSAGTMQYSRTSPTAKLLSNGEVLVTGGAVVTQAEFYVPPAPASVAAPVLSSLNPASVTAGGNSTALFVFGFNFVNTSVVNFNGAARTTAFASATDLSITLSSADIATAGTASVTVTNPLGGSGGGGTSNPLTLTITSANVQPVVGTLNPASATAGGPAFQLTVSGSNFTANSSVSFGGTAMPTIFSSPTALLANIPASAIAVAGTPIVVVTNPGGALSAAVTFTVNNPTPLLTQLTPSTAPPGSAALPLQVAGSNFNPSANVLVNGQPISTMFVNATLLHATLPTSDMTLAGTLNVTVVNASPGGSSNILPFAVAAVIGQPIASGLSPASATAGSPGFTLSVSGSNFMSSSVVSFGGIAMNTAFVSASQVTASIPASSIAVAGTPTVSVANSGGNPSIALTFTVNNPGTGNNPAPQVTLLTPPSAAAGSAALQVNVTGNNFVPSSGILVNGQPIQTFFVSATILQATLPASDLAQGGTLNISVVTPAPGGGTTLALPFLVSSAGSGQPVVSALSPPSTTAGGPAFSLTVSGGNFTLSSVVSFGGIAMNTTFVSASQVSANIPASAIAVAGTPTVSVANSGGTPSTVLTFTVNNPITGGNPVPIIGALLPLSASPSGAALPLQVTGGNFNSLSSILINGAAVPTQFVSGTVLTTTIPAIYLSAVRTLQIEVKNAPPSGGVSSQITFTVNDFLLKVATPTATVTAGAPGVFNLMVDPANPAVPFTDPISLSVTSQIGTPVLTPSTSFTLNANSQPVTLTIATTAPQTTTSNDLPRGNRRVLMMLCLFVMAFAVSGLALRTARRRIPRLAPQFLWALLLVAVAGLASCTGSVATPTPTTTKITVVPGTPAGTYTITVTATSGTTTHTVPVTLTVM